MTSFSRTDISLLSRWWWTVDRWTLATVILLAMIGLVLTMAASPPVAERLSLEPFYFARRQAIYLPIAFVILLVTSLLSPKGVRRVALLVLIVSFLLTIATLLLGIEIKGARRWLDAGGVSFQPSEFLKPAFAVVCAWLFAEARMREGVRGYALGTGLLLAVAAILALQPDIGTTALILGAWAVQVFLVGCPLALVGLLGVMFLGGGILAYFSFHHVRSRVDLFLTPGGSDGFGQVDRAMQAFRSGGLFGRGPGEGRVKEALPDAHADFIFAVAGEEFGLLVCLILVGLFAFVVLQAFSRALKDGDLFVVLATASLATLFGAQALMNMASTLHIMPPKGITLPFISYGGSSAIALAWTMGMVLALTRERPKSGGRD